MNFRAPGLAFALALPLVANADGVTIGVGIPTNPIAISESATQGVIDSTWGNNGYVTFSDQSIITQAMDRDGRLLIAGQSSGSGTLVRRLLANGHPDTSFGSNGKVSISLGSAALKDRPVAIIPMADRGFYILIDHDLDPSSTSSTYSYSLVYADAAGSIISTPGGSTGVKFTGAGVGADVIRDAEGRLYLLSATGTLNPASGKMDWSLQRLLPDGTPDTSFGSSGAINWSSNYASVIGMLAGDHVQALYFDPDNTSCSSRMLIISESGATTDLCDPSTTGRPIKMVSVPTPSLSAIEFQAPLRTTAASGSGPYVFIEWVDLRAYPAGMLYTGSPNELYFQTFNPSISSAHWIFDSPEHLVLTQNAIGTKIQPDVNGGFYISFNTLNTNIGYSPYQPPATIFHSKGYAQDTTPAGLTNSPAISSDGSNYISGPIAIAGLGDYVGVPARVTGGEVSLDGTNWYKGWIWAQNGQRLFVRYASTANLTIGGIVTPGNPSLPLGNVLTVSFSGSTATVTNPATPAPDSGSSSDGGSTDFGFVLFAGLLALLKARRKQVAARINH